MNRNLSWSLFQNQKKKEKKTSSKNQIVKLLPKMLRRVKFLINHPFTLISLQNSKGRRTLKRKKKKEKERKIGKEDRSSTRHD